MYMGTFITKLQSAHAHYLPVKYVSVPQKVDVILESRFPVFLKLHESSLSSLPLFIALYFCLSVKVIRKVVKRLAD